MGIVIAAGVRYALRTSMTSKPGPDVSEMRSRARPAIGKAPAKKWGTTKAIPKPTEKTAPPEKTKAKPLLPRKPRVVR